MVMDMINAGIDTTGNTLAFLIYNLARNPDKQQKLREEIQSFGSGKLSASDVGKMKYFHACLKESLRVLPTVPYMGRLLPEETIIRGYKIPAKTFVMWSAIITGKDPEIFPNPEKFLPERWIEGKENVRGSLLSQNHEVINCCKTNYEKILSELFLN
jgi:cytochrome P450